MRKKDVKKNVKRIVSGKKVAKKKSFLDSGFFAGFMGAKAAGASDEEALISGVIFDDED
jgi:hypothetical protein